MGLTVVSKLRLTAVVLFAALSLFLIAFGVLYASVTNLLSFHAAAVPDSAIAEIKPLYLALMKLIGGSAAALGLLGLYVTLYPMRKGDILTPIALSLAYAIAFVMAAIVAEKLSDATGAPTSWHIMGALLTVTAVALFASLVARVRTRA